MRSRENTFIVLTASMSNSEGRLFFLFEEKRVLRLPLFSNIFCYGYLDSN